MNSRPCGRSCAGGSHVCRFRPMAGGRYDDPVGRRAGRGAPPGQSRRSAVRQGGGSKHRGPAGTIRLRTFSHEQPEGVLLHIHGGAWMAGSPEMMDLLHEIIVDKCNVSVVSVDYRLAPEHPYPSGPDDCEAAACWLIEHAAEEFGSDQLLIAGESAGAHLAAVTLLRMRDKHQAADRFLGANLVFGAYDLSRTPSQRGVGVEPEPTYWTAPDSRSTSTCPACPRRSDVTLTSHRSTQTSAACHLHCSRLVPTTTF